MALPESFYQGARRISHNIGLAASSRAHTLNVTRIPEASSLLKPCPRNVKRWRADNGFDVIEERLVNCVTLQDFAKANGITGCDLMKLDTQGTELDILLSGKEIVRNTGVILMEIEFVKLYENQPLFGEIVGELAKLGFRFVNFIHGHSDGGLGYEPQKRIWSDTLFVRDPVSVEEAIRTGIILCEFDYTIEARWFMEDNGVPSENISEIMTAYKQLKLSRSGFLTRRVFFPLAVFVKNSSFVRGQRGLISVLIRVASKFRLGKFLVQLLQRS
jgi:FkbM family methyltransferase